MNLIKRVYTNYWLAFIITGAIFAFLSTTFLFVIGLTSAFIDKLKGVSHGMGPSHVPDFGWLYWLYVIIVYSYFFGAFVSFAIVFFIRRAARLKN